MGIRIKKVLGYGLYDVEAEEYDITDKRFKIDAKEKLDQASPGDFAGWLMENEQEAAEIVALTKPKRKIGQSIDLTLRFAIEDWKKGERVGLHSYPIWNPEYGDPNTIMFVPIEAKNWYRTDDVIDYYENSGTPNDPQIQHLNRYCGIYPYIGAVRIPNMPKVADLDDFLTPADWSMLLGTFREDRGPELGEDIAEQVKNSYRVAIPDSIVLYTHWLDIFEDWEKTVHELTPALYTFWS